MLDCTCRVGFVAAAFVKVSLVEVTDSIHKVPLKGGPGSEVDHFTLASQSSPSNYFNLLSAKDSDPDKSKGSKDLCLAYIIFLCL